MMGATVTPQYLARFVADLELKSLTDQLDAIANEVIENGGTWIDPEEDNPNRRISSLCEISLHGVVARGTSQIDALKVWKRAANARLQDLEWQPGTRFRNHAEEIDAVRRAYYEGVN